jgi:hypothetical protein
MRVVLECTYNILYQSQNFSSIYIYATVLVTYIYKLYIHIYIYKLYIYIYNQDSKAWLISNIVKTSLLGAL